MWTVVMREWSSISEGERTAQEVFLVTGKSKGLSLLVFIGGWVRLDEAEAAKGSTSHGEDLSDLWIVVDSPH